MPWILYSLLHDPEGYWSDISLCRLCILFFFVFPFMLHFVLTFSCVVFLHSPPLSFLFFLNFFQSDLLMNIFFYYNRLHHRSLVLSSHPNSAFFILLISLFKSSLPLSLVVSPIIYILSITITLIYFSFVFILSFMTEKNLGKTDLLVTGSEQRRTESVTWMGIIICIPIIYCNLFCFFTFMLCISPAS